MVSLSWTPPSSWRGRVLFPNSHLRRLGEAGSCFQILASVVLSSSSCTGGKGSGKEGLKYSSVYPQRDMEKGKTDEVLDDCMPLDDFEDGVSRGDISEENIVPPMRGSERIIILTARNQAQMAPSSKRQVMPMMTTGFKGMEIGVHHQAVEFNKLWVKSLLQNVNWLLKRSVSIAHEKKEELENSLATPVREIKRRQWRDNSQRYQKRQKATVSNPVAQLDKNVEFQN
ncbi:hypothetical protein EJB05_04879, partial [Eragrostis curvula]